MKTRRRKRGGGRAAAAAGLFDELIVDLFAGGGGASMGIERALGRAVDVAINHDVEAVAMHQANHPHTIHHCESVWKARPRDVVGSRRVGLLWLSPDCTHFSGARGGTPVKKHIRGLAWVAIRWAATVRPRVIMLENVREFQTWGPVVPKVGGDGVALTWKDGSPQLVPCPRRKGQTFKRWFRELRRLGYEVETRVLNAADYGAATHRRRFFLVARCDGETIRWPEPTYGPGRAHPYRAAAEFIDWSRPCPSIFLSPEEAKPLGIRRPLAENTMKRIAAGLKRFVLDNPRPFIVRCNHGRDEFRGQPVGQPLGTVTSHHGYGLVAPLFGAQFGEAPGQAPRAHRADEPIPTITPRQGGGFPLVMAHVSRFFGGMVGRAASEPLPTITATDHHAAVAAYLGQIGHRDADKPGPALDGPINTILGKEHHTLTTAYITRNNYGEKPADGADEPLRTITTQGNKFALTSANLVRIGQTNGNGHYVNGVEAPLTTITSKAEHCVAAAHVSKFYGTGIGSAAGEPLHTVTGKGNHFYDVRAALSPAGVPATWEVNERGEWVRNRAEDVRAFLLKYYGTNVGTDPADPLHTVTATDRFGLVTVAGVDYEVFDIGLRMLTPRELFGCQGFPAEYVLDPFVKGRKLPKDAQTRMVGNSVPPQLPEALVRANFPEECPAPAGSPRARTRRRPAEVTS